MSWSGVRPCPPVCTRCSLKYAWKSSSLFSRSAVVQAQHAIQILASNRADQPLHKRMGERNMGDGFDLGHLQYPQIGLPLPKPKKGSWSELRYLGIHGCHRMARLNIRQSATPLTVPA